MAKSSYVLSGIDMDLARIIVLSKWQLKTHRRGVLKQSSVPEKGLKAEMGMRPLQVIPWSPLKDSGQGKNIFGVNLTWKTQDRKRYLCTRQ